MRLQHEARDAEAASIACCASGLPPVIATSLSPGAPKRIPAPAARTAHPIERTALARSRIFRDDLDHPIVDLAVAGDESPAVERERLAAIAADATARFRADDCTCRDIPCVQTGFPESVEAAARDVAQIERRRSVAPDRSRDLQEVAERMDVRQRIVDAVRRKPRDEHRGARVVAR